MDRYETLGVSHDFGIPNSDKELIRYGYDIERLSEAVAVQGAAPSGTTGIEFAYLRDRVASIPATSLAGAAAKLRGLMAGRARGLRLGDMELALLRNVLDVVESAVASRVAMAQPTAEIPPAPVQGVAIDDPSIESLISQFTATAVRHRALIAHNLALRTGAGMSVARTQALRLNLDCLSSALGIDAIEDPDSEAKLLALFGYWNARRGTGAIPARTDIDPLELTDLWPDLGLWRVETATGLRCRLCGTHVSALVAEDLSGKLISEARKDFWTEQRRALENVAKSGRPALLAGSIGGGAIGYRVLMLPLSSDGRTVDMVLTATVFQNVQGEIEQPYLSSLTA